MPEEETDDIREHIRTGAPFDPIILRALNDYFRQHLIIGGPPEVSSGCSDKER